MHYCTLFFSFFFAFDIIVFSFNAHMGLLISSFLSSHDLPLLFFEFSRTCRGIYMEYDRTGVFLFDLLLVFFCPIFHFIPSISIIG